MKTGPMNSKKAYYIMAGCTVLMFGVLGVTVVLGDMWLHKRSDQLRSVKLETRLLDEQQVSLVQANKDVAKYSDLESIANAIVPQDKDQAKTVREIVKLAQESNIPITSISFPTSSLGSAAQAPAASSSTADTSNSSESPSASAAAKAPPVTQVKAADGISGVYQMEINVQSDSSLPVPYAALITFLERLEQNRRTAQVSNITVTPSTKDPGLVTFTLMVNVYIKP